jgi:hypothetical protein
MKVYQWYNILLGVVFIGGYLLIYYSSWKKDYDVKKENSKKNNNIKKK